MPLVIKVSVSRKLSQDYNSRGWTLDIQSEFDPRVFDDTETLANSTNHLFALANDLLDQQVQQASDGARVNGNGHQKPTYDRTDGQRHNGRPERFGGDGAYSGKDTGNGSGNGRQQRASDRKESNARPERPITEAQVRAIRKLAEQFDTNGDAVAREDYNTDLAKLTIRQASDLIQRLKASLEGQELRGAGR